MRYILTGKRRVKGKMTLVLALILGLCGCSGQNAIFTDAGTDVVIHAQKEDYLDLSALDQETTEDKGFNGYDVYTLAYGTFQTNSAVFSASGGVLETTVVRAEYDSGTMRLTQMVAERYCLVEKGDVIATVSMETNELDKEELELKLLRVRERYEEFKAEHEAAREEAEKQVSLYEIPGKIDRIYLAQAELDFARQEKAYLQQIESYEEQKQELEKLMNQTQILAPTAGMVMEISAQAAGSKLENGDMLAKIIPFDQVYMNFGDELTHYGYGNEVTFIVGRNINSVEYPAKIISTNGKALGSGWDKSRSYIKPEVEITDILTDGPFYVSAITNVMENVLILPAAAVTRENDKCFVTVLHEDGRLEKKQFLAGGSNTEYYWVYDGLEEGTNVLINKM